MHGYIPQGYIHDNPWCRCVAQGGRPQRRQEKGSSAVLPTRLFGYFRVFREPHSMVLPGIVRFQTGERLSTDLCSTDYGSIDHFKAKAMGKRLVRPSPSVLGYFSSNSGSI